MSLKRLSLLQYMKHTTLDNPDVTVKDERITNAEAAEEAGISEEEFIEQMNSKGSCKKH